MVDVMMFYGSFWWIRLREWHIKYKYEWMIQTKPLTVLTAILIWIVAMICATPAAIVSTILPMPNDSNATYCSPFGDGPNVKTYEKWVFFTLLIFIEVTLMHFNACWLRIAQMHEMNIKRPNTIYECQTFNNYECLNVVHFISFYFIWINNETNLHHSYANPKIN